MSAVAVLALTMCALGGVVILSEDSDAALGTYTGGANQSSFDNPYTGINVSDMLTNLKSATPEIDGDSTYYDIGIYIESGSEVYIGKNITSLEWGYFDNYSLHLDDETLTVSGFIVDEGVHADDFMDPILTWSDRSTYSLYTFSVCIVETPEADVDFTSPRAVDGLSGDSFSYTARTNIDCTFSEAGGNATWLSLDSSSGRVTGTLPTVSSPSDYTFTIKATSESNSSNTATQTITISVYPIIEISSSVSSIIGTVGEAITPVILSSGNLDVVYRVGSYPLPDGLQLSSNSISGTPAESGSGYFLIRATAAEGPTQTENYRIDYDIEPAEDPLSISIADPKSSYKVGESVSLDITCSVSGSTFEVSGSAASWMDVSGSKVVGSVPSSYTDVTSVSLTVTAESPKGQTASDTVNFSVEPVVQYTSVPTVSCIISPVYDSVQSVKSTNLSLFSEVSAADPEDSESDYVFSFPDTMTIQATFTGQNADTVTWYWGDGSSDVGNKFTHTYDEPGTYTILLVASNDLGDTELEITVTVGESPYSLLYIGAIAVLLIVAVYLVYRIVKGGDRRGRR